VSKTFSGEDYLRYGRKYNYSDSEVQDHIDKILCEGDRRTSDIQLNSLGKSGSTVSDLNKSKFGIGVSNDIKSIDDTKSTSLYNSFCRLLYYADKAKFDHSIYEAISRSGDDWDSAKLGKLECEKDIAAMAVKSYYRDFYSLFPERYKNTILRLYNTILDSDMKHSCGPDTMLNVCIHFSKEHYGRGAKIFKLTDPMNSKLDSSDPLVAFNQYPSGNCEEKLNYVSEGAYVVVEAYELNPSAVGLEEKETAHSNVMYSSRDFHRQNNENQVFDVQAVSINFLSRCSENLKAGLHDAGQDLSHGTGSSNEDFYINKPVVVVGDEII